MYQPRSIVKQRPAPQSPKIKMVEPVSAIKINLESITSANESQSQKEAEVASVLSQFTPLSLGPVNPSGDHFEVDRDRVRELNQPSLQELSYSEPEDRSPQSFKPKRRGLWLILALVVAWAGFTVMKVGADQLVQDPVTATKVALEVAEPPSESTSEPQIEEVIEIGELTATLSEPVRYAKGWVLIEGVVENSTASSQTEIKLKVSLTYEKSAPFQEQLYCCVAPDEGDEAREAWLKAELVRLKRSEPADEERASTVIAPQGQARFLRLYKLPNRASALPTATVQVTWNEPIDHSSTTSPPEGAH